MIVSTKGRYALMVMIDLANHDDGGYVSLADISDRQKLSMKYLENVVSMLNKGGMLRSLRGKNGGYRLIKSPEDYNIGEILAPVDCIKSGEVSCGRAHSCVTLPLWIGLDKVIDEYLDNITLQDLMTGNVDKLIQDQDTSR